jgi:hypothetical protein
MLLRRNGEDLHIPQQATCLQANKNLTKGRHEAPLLHQELGKMHGLMNALERQPNFEDHVNKE